jgi:hypothetical protein
MVERDHIQRSGFFIIENETVVIFEDFLNLRILVQADLLAAEIAVERRDGIAAAEEHITAGGQDNGEQDDKPNQF